MLLIANDKFNSDKSIKIFDALIKASNDDLNSGLQFITKTNIQISIDSNIEKKITNF